MPQSKELIVLRRFESLIKTDCISTFDLNSTAAYSTLEQITNLLYLE